MVGFLEFGQKIQTELGRRFMVEDVEVTFQLMSGDRSSVRVPRDITSWELHQLATSLFDRSDLKIFWGCTLLTLDHDRPLVVVEQTDVCLHVVLQGGKALDSFIDLIRRGKFSTASMMLHRQPKLAALRDSSDNTALAWAAYHATQSLDSMNLICHLLSKAQHLVKVPCKGLRFLPLHEAAWGNAPTAVAVVLCAAYPSAVYARAKDRSTPHDVGRYYHRNFAWPAVDKLLEMAENLRAQCKLVRSLQAVRHSATVHQFGLLQLGFLEQDVAACLGLPMSIAARVADLVDAAVPTFIRNALAAFHSNEAYHSNNENLSSSRSQFSFDSRVMTVDSQSDVPENPSHAAMPLQNPEKPSHCRRRSKRQMDDHAGRRRQRPPRGRCLRASNCFHQIDVESVEYVREAFSKERGRFAGFRRVRNRKCIFPIMIEVAVGSVIHRLLAHSVCAVRDKDTEPRAVWPDKKQLLKDRTRDRDAKYEDVKFM